MNIWQKSMLKIFDIFAR